MKTRIALALAAAGLILGGFGTTAAHADHQCNKAGQETNGNPRLQPSSSAPGQQDGGGWHNSADGAERAPGLSDCN